MTALVRAFRKHPFLSTAITVVLAVYMLLCIKAGNDFLTFYELGAMSLQRAGHLYDPTPSTGMTVPYLPHFFLLMMPWALLPFGPSAGLWFCFKMGLLTQLVRKFRIWSSSYSMRERNLHVVLALAVCLNYVNDDFRLGQVNLIIHALLIACFIALLAGRSAWASLLFVVSSIKITPLALLPYFVLRRQWKFLLGVAGWGAVFAILLIAWFGWEEMAAFPGRFLDLTTTHKLGLLQLAGIKNQSISGVVSRFATDITHDGTGGTPLQLGLGPVDPNLYSWITFGICSLLMGGVCLWVLLRRPAHLNLAEYSAFLVVMLLVSPDTRTAHMVHLLLPAYVLISGVPWDRFRLRDHGWLPIVFVVFLGTSRDLVGRTVYDYAHYISLQTAVMLLLLALLVLPFRHEDARGR